MYQVGERFHLQVGQQHLAHGPHDAEHEKADDGVHQDDRRAGQRNDLARAHEQAGTNCATDRNKLDMPVFQPALEHAAIFRNCALRVARLLHS
ncbi:hypothetical protein KI429_07995 [Pseudomonas shirazica]|nr:hypothetical protein KI429_07995 [Pseudomonas shirazica]